MQYPPTSLPRMAMPDDILAGADLVELQPISPDRLMPDFGEHVLVTTASGRHVEAQRVPGHCWRAKNGDTVEGVVAWVCWPWEGNEA